MRQTRPADPRVVLKLTVALLFVAIVLLFMPTFLGSAQVTHIVSLICAAVGVAGLGIDLTRLAGMKVWLNDLGMGLTLVFVSVGLGLFFDSVLLHYALMIGLLGGAYGIVSWFVEFSSMLLRGQPAIARGYALSIIAHLIGMLAGLVTILQILRVSDLPWYMLSLP